MTAVTPISLAPDPRILVVALCPLGEMLLTTPLIRSIKQAFPSASIDALVFAGTNGILAGNPDLAGVLTLPRNPRLSESLALRREIKRNYDLALAAQIGNRPAIMAWVAGRQCAAPVKPHGIVAAIKRLVFSRSATTNQEQHRVLDMLGLAEAIGIPPVAELVCPAGEVRAGLIPANSYAVVHPASMFAYKRWRIDGWRMLAAALRARDLATLVTGARDDRAYLDEVWGERDVIRLDGKLDWPEVSAVIASAKIYVGLDTAVTHLAAAKGTPTVALYGATDPRVWGPWPRGGLDRPWDVSGAMQNRGNVWLVQDASSEQQEGDGRRSETLSRGLNELSVAQVLSAVDQAFAASRAV